MYTEQGRTLVYIFSTLPDVGVTLMTKTPSSPTQGPTVIVASTLHSLVKQFKTWSYYSTIVRSYVIVKKCLFSRLKNVCLSEFWEYVNKFVLEWLYNHTPLLQWHPVESVCVLDTQLNVYLFPHHLDLTLPSHQSGPLGWQIHLQILQLRPVLRLHVSSLFLVFLDLGEE